MKILNIARYKIGWDNFSTGRNSFKNDEFVPCMISGNPTSKWDKRNLLVVGHTGSYNINDFEIIKGSDKGFEELIKLYTKSSKFNL